MPANALKSTQLAKPTSVNVPDYDFSDPTRRWPARKGLVPTRSRVSAPNACDLAQEF